MKTRILSSIVGIVIGISILVIDISVITLSAISFISVVAVYEILVATKYIKNKTISIYSLFYATISPFLYAYEDIKSNLPIICFLFITGLFVIMLFIHSKTDFSQVCLIAVVSICIPLSFCAIYFMRYLYGTHGIFCIVYTLSMTWLSDSGAYFVGRALGKHKLASEISPKKTWEGFFGGIITVIVFAIIFAFTYEFIMLEMGFSVETNKLAFILYGVCTSLLGVLGDLSASIVKRSCIVKDFGNIMPGHGGVLDRFDSLLFAAPFMYYALNLYFPIKDIITT